MTQDDDWLALSPLAAARAKRQSGGHRAAHRAAAVAALKAHEAQAAEAAEAPQVVVGAVEAAAEAHQEAGRAVTAAAAEAHAPTVPELRRVYEWDPVQGRYVDVLRPYWPKVKPSRKEAKAERDAAKAERNAIKAAQAAKIAAFPGLPRVPDHPAEVKDLNRGVRIETGDHQPVAGPGRHRTGQDPWHAKSDQKMRCHDDGHNQNHMRDSRFYSR